MSAILTLEHSARLTKWDEARGTPKKSRKLSNRAKLALFVAFNAGVWALFLSPVLFR